MQVRGIRPEYPVFRMLVEACGACGRPEVAPLVMFLFSCPCPRLLVSFFKCIKHVAKRMYWINCQIRC